MLVVGDGINYKRWGLHVVTETLAVGHAQQAGRQFWWTCIRLQWSDSLTNNQWWLFLTSVWALFYIFFWVAVYHRSGSEWMISFFHQRSAMHSSTRMSCVVGSHNPKISMYTGSSAGWIISTKITKNVPACCHNRESARCQTHRQKARPAPILLVQVARKWCVSLTCMHDVTQQSKITNNGITQQTNTNKASQ